jgi:hypothetical protein
MRSYLDLEGSGGAKITIKQASPRRTSQINHFLCRSFEDERDRQDEDKAAVDVDRAELRLRLGEAERISETIILHPTTTMKRQLISPSPTSSRRSMRLTSRCREEGI